MINGVPLNLGGDSLDIRGVTGCQVCQNRQCKNGGTCLPAASDRGYNCQCARGYSGSTCELVGEKCTSSESC